MNEAFEFLTVESDGSVARITLRRPPLNILHLPMIEELNRAIGSLDGLPALCALVLDAEGRAFSAGVAVEDHMPDRVRATIGAFHEVFRKLFRLGCPTLAAVQGAALGGGCELACFADWVIASEAATLGLPEIKLGSFPPLAAVHFPQRIGRARTLQMILTGDLLSARDAEGIGLVDQVVTAESLSASVEAVLARLREKSAPVLRLAKRAVIADAAAFEGALTEVEGVFLDRLMKAEDAVEGLSAFFEKRVPRWTHRPPGVE